MSILLQQEKVVDQTEIDRYWQAKAEQEALAQRRREFPFWRLVHWLTRQP